MKAKRKMLITVQEVYEDGTINEIHFFDNFERVDYHTLLREVGPFRQKLDELENPKTGPIKF